MKNCVKLMLLTSSEGVSVKSNVSYCFMGCVAGEAVAETGTQRGDWGEKAAALWPRVWVLPDGHLRALVVPSLGPPQTFPEHLQSPGPCLVPELQGEQTAPVLGELLRLRKARESEAPWAWLPRAGESGSASLPRRTRRLLDTVL